MDEAHQLRAAFAQDLREARSYRKIELEQVAQETRITLPYLQALEKGEWERLPGPFLRGYLSAYAECLGMNLEKVLRRFDELGFQGQEEAPAADGAPAPRMPFAMGQRRAEEQAPLHAPPRKTDPVPPLIRALPLSVKVTLASSLVLVAALLLWGLTSLVLGLLHGGGDGAVPEELLPEAPVEGAADDRELPPFKVRLELSQEDHLSVLSSEGQIFNGNCPADSALEFTSTREVIVEVAHLERLRLWRNGQPHDLDTLSGPRELRLLPGSVGIERRPGAQP
jgi:hypothetical protein